MLPRLQKGAIFFALTAALSLTYYFITEFLLWFLLDTSIRDHIPTAIDFLQYWKEVYNFLGCAAHTGYFGHEELLSTLNMWGVDSPGASHGIGNTLFYAFFGLPAWQFDTPIYINLALTSLGFGLYWLLANLPLKRAALALLGFLSLYPVYFLNAHNSFQSAHFLLSCLVAGLIARLLDTEDPKRRLRLWIGLAATLAAGAFLRKNWALLLLALAFLPQVTARRRGLLLGCALAATAILNICFDMTRSPYPYPEFAEDLRPYVLPALSQGDFSVLWRQIAINLQTCVSFVGKQDFDTIYGLFLLVAGGALLVDMPPDRRRGRLRWFGAVALALSFVSAAVIYYVFQIMLVKVVMQTFVVLFLATIRYTSVRTVAALLLVNILFLPAFFDRFRRIGEEYLYTAEKLQSIDQFRQQTEPFFSKPASDRWRNTLLIFGYRPELLGLPPCIHIMDTWESFLRERNYRVRTGFVLVSDPATEKRLTENNVMRLLASTTAGRLYAVE